MTIVRQIFQRNRVLLALALGVLVAGVLLFALWPRGIVTCRPGLLIRPGQARRALPFGSLVRVRV